MPRRSTVPKLTRHKASGRGVVRLSGTDVYLGLWPDPDAEPPPAVRAAYDRAVAEWLGDGRRPRAAEARADDGADPGGPTIAELMLAYWDHAQVYYRHPGGTPTSELGELRYSLRPLSALYADLP